MVPHELFMIQCVRVQPLHEIFEVFGSGFRKVERCRPGFGEVVGMVEGGGEERRNGAEGF